MAVVVNTAPETILSSISTLGLLKDVLPNENAIVVLAGYQAKNTNGYHLKNLQNYSDAEKTTIILGEIGLSLSDVKCKIVDLSEFYSGHADQDMLFTYVAGYREKQNDFPTRVFLNHGQDDARIALKERIIQKENIEVLIPNDLAWHDLNTGQKIEDYEEKVVSENSVVKFELNDISISVPTHYGEFIFQKVRDFLRTLT